MELCLCSYNLGREECLKCIINQKQLEDLDDHTHTHTHIKMGEEDLNTRYLNTQMCQAN